jgi:hypothetical protein
MSKILPVLVTLAVIIIFPAFIFYLLIRAIRCPGTRWWGIVILLAILTCYCTTMVGIAGLIVGGAATGSAALEQHYCEAFREVLSQTESLPDAVARMDAVSAGDAYQIREPDKNLRFRFVWLLGGCFLFAGANLMMFGPGRRERRHPADCVVMIVAALVVFLTGIWQIAWGNGYAYQAGSYHRMLTVWHENIRLDAIHETNAQIAAKLDEDGVKNLYGLWKLFLDLSGEKTSGISGGNRKPDPAGSGEKETDPAGSGVAIIGGADGPTAVFITSELTKEIGRQAEKVEGAGLPTEAEAPAAPAGTMPAAEEKADAADAD